MKSLDITLGSRPASARTTFPDPSAEPLLCTFFSSPRVLGRGVVRLPSVSFYLVGPSVGAHKLSAAALTPRSGSLLVPRRVPTCAAARSGFPCRDKHATPLRLGSVCALPHQKRPAKLNEAHRRYAPLGRLAHSVELPGHHLAVSASPDSLFRASTAGHRDCCVVVGRHTAHVLQWLRCAIWMSARSTRGALNALRATAPHLWHQKSCAC